MNRRIIAENPEKVAIVKKHRRFLKRLSPREQRVLKLRFGLEDGCYRTQNQVGKILGLTGEAIRRIEDEGLKKLRRHAL